MSYVLITKLEFDMTMAQWSVLHPDYRCEPPLSKDHDNYEWVYVILLSGEEEKIKIYSSLTSRAGVSRPVGKDAIRIVWQTKRGDGTNYWRKTKRIYRVSGWEKRLIERLEEIVVEFEKNNPQARQKFKLMGHDEGTFVTDQPNYKLISRPEQQTTSPDVPVVAHRHNAYAERCVYCGSPDVNGEVEGIGTLCAAHMDYINDQPVMSYFAVYDEPKVVTQTTKPARLDWFDE